jgi:hypothetical protein
MGLQFTQDQECTTGQAQCHPYYGYKLYFEPSGSDAWIVQCYAAMLEGIIGGGVLTGIRIFNRGASFFTLLIKEGLNYLKENSIYFALGKAFFSGTQAYIKGDDAPDRARLFVDGLFCDPLTPMFKIP